MKEATKTQTETKTRGISFTTEMVKAILEGRKVMTRRIIKPISKRGLFNPVIVGPTDPGDSAILMQGGGRGYPNRCEVLICPYGRIGDRLWVRETWSESLGYGGDPDAIIYKADGRVRFHDDKTFILEDDEPLFDACLADGWKPSIFMPRWASRITLEITNIRVERLFAITNEDAEKEGVEKWGDGNYKAYGKYPGKFTYPRDSFFSLWSAINGKESLDSNPWVWCISFRKL